MAVLRPSGEISSSILQSACASGAMAGITAGSSAASDGQEGGPGESAPVESDADTEPESAEGDKGIRVFDRLDDLEPESSPPPRVQPGIVQHAAIDAFSRMGKLTSIQMPWESPSVSAIFSDLSATLQPSLAACWPGNVQNVPAVQPQIENIKPAVDVNFVTAQGPVFAKVVKSRQGVTPQQKRQRDWLKAVNIWTDVCVRFRRECEPGLAAKDVPEQAAFREAVFANVEANAWRYVSQLKDMEAAPTKAEAFLSSARFAHFVLGFNLALVVDSKRVKGVAQQMFAGKEALKQALPLSVHQVLQLHQGLADVSRHLVDRAMCAYVLIALYGRARHSDLEQISSIKHDHDKYGGFLEILTRKHKGAKSAQKKSKFLPILVPAIGVHGKPWMHLLVDVFQRLSLPVDGAIDGPVLPAPRDSGGEEFSCRAIESGEVTAFLRQFLGLPAPVAGERGVSSHSLKATCLSWVNKYGVSDRTQTVLGRHCKCASTADAVYARDMCVGPTRELQRIIEAIAGGDFRPDEARSRYFRFPPRPPSPVAEVLENQRKDEESVQSAAAELEEGEASEPEEPFSLSPACGASEQDDSSSSSSDDGCSSSDEEDQPPPAKAQRLRGRAPVNADAQVWWVHRRSKMLHLVNGQKATPDEEQIFACGRSVSRMFRPAEDADVRGPVCNTCAKNA
ncbi:unnamed protein product [Symbiodinium natans]|uniref:Uncharacterized protein n=1 Tax=Symbiodinium natans TaxID=878477 RepID=A0A812L8K5_9DINO|nr:unnamed protein product [Symbiodinium natans]